MLHLGTLSNPGVCCPTIAIRSLAFCLSLTEARSVDTRSIEFNALKVTHMPVACCIMCKYVKL